MIPGIIEGASINFDPYGTLPLWVPMGCILHLDFASQLYWYDIQRTVDELVEGRFTIGDSAGDGILIEPNTDEDEFGETATLVKATPLMLSAFNAWVPNGFTIVIEWEQDTLTANGPMMWYFDGPDADNYDNEVAIEHFGSILEGYGSVPVGGGSGGYYGTTPTDAIIGVNRLAMTFAWHPGFGEWYRGGCSLNGSDQYSNSVSPSGWDSYWDSDFHIGEVIPTVENIYFFSIPEWWWYLEGARLRKITLFPPISNFRLADFSNYSPTYIQTDPEPSDVKLDISFDDASDGSTTVVDESPSAHPVTLHGNAQVDVNTQGSSLLVDGNGDYASIPDHTDFTLGNNEFTIELDVRFADDWVQPNVPSGTSSQRTWRLAGQTGPDRTLNYFAWAINYRVEGVNLDDLSGPSFEYTSRGWWNNSNLDHRTILKREIDYPFLAGVTYHIAVSRDVYGIIRIFVNDLMVHRSMTITSEGAPIFNSSEPIIISSKGTDKTATSAEGYTDEFDGWIDNFRITNGASWYHHDGIPWAITDLVAVPISDFEVQLDFTHPVGINEFLVYTEFSGADYYIYRIRQTDTADDWVEGGPLLASEIVTVDALGEYEVQLAGVNAVGQGLWSNVATFNTNLALSIDLVTVGKVGTAFTGFTAVANGGFKPYTFTVHAGSLPPGLTLDASTGEVTGTPTTEGDYSGITIRVTDDDGTTADVSFAMHIFPLVTAGRPMAMNTPHYGTSMLSPTLSTNLQSGVFVAETGVMIPVVVDKTREYTSISFNVASVTTAPLARVGIYSHNELTGGPSSLVLDAGTIAINTVGTKTLPISVSLPAGTYHIMVAADAAFRLSVAGSRQLYGIMGLIGAETIGYLEVLLSQSINDPLPNTINVDELKDGGGVTPVIALGGGVNYFRATDGADSAALTGLVITVGELAATDGADSALVYGPKRTVDIAATEGPDSFHASVHTFFMLLSGDQQVSSTDRILLSGDQSGALTQSMVEFIRTDGDFTAIEGSDDAAFSDAPENAIAMNNETLTLNDEILILGSA